MISYLQFDGRHAFTDMPKLWYHAIFKERVIGQLSIRIDVKQWAWLNDLCVADGYRRCGVARNLIMTAKVQSLGMPGIIGMCAGISPGNAASSALFRKCGFQHVYGWEGMGDLYSRPFTADEVRAI